MIWLLRSLISPQNGFAAGLGEGRPELLQAILIHEWRVEQEHKLQHGISLLALVPRQNIVVDVATLVEVCAKLQHPIVGMF